MKVLGILLLVSYLVCVNGAHILAVHGTEINSHFQVFIGVIAHLAPFHNITFYMYSSVFHYEPPPNVVVRTFDAPGRIQTLNMAELFQNPCNIDTCDLFYQHVLTVNETYFETILKSVNTSILQDIDEQYDLLLMSAYGSEHLYQLAHILDIPFVQVSPSLLFPWHNKALNNPYSWTNDLSFMIPEKDNTFFSRLDKFWKNAQIHYRYYWQHIKIIDRIAKKYYPPNTPKIEQLSERTDLILENTHSIMGYTRPSISTIVEIGGLHIKPSKPLPMDLESFISGAGKHGFIYFSLGSMIQESVMNDQIRKSILKVFSKLPQRVLWKWNGRMNDVPSNVKIQKWFPQGDILAHKNIKIFITQGGMLSMQESVFHGVPTLVFPLLFDQYINAYMANEKGYGKTMNFCNFSEELFEKYLRDMIQNLSYSKTSKEMSRVMKYQNKNLPGKLNWWIDYVIQNRGTKFLQSRRKYQTWIEIPNDVFIFLLFIIFSLLHLIACIYSYINGIIVNYSKKKCKSE